jgi:hypothetical protein
MRRKLAARTNAREAFFVILELPEHDDFGIIPS